MHDPQSAHRTLRRLLDEQFLTQYGLVATPQALRAALLHSGYVGELRRALAAEEIADESIRKFVSSVLSAWRTGYLFPYDVALAAIAVVLETRATPFADEFLTDLGRLDRAELPMAIRVARRALGEHGRMTATINLTGNVTLADPQISGWQPAPPLFSQKLAECSTESYEYGAA